MTSPVRKIGYLNKAEITAEMALAGDSVLAENEDERVDEAIEELLEGVWKQ